MFARLVAKIASGFGERRKLLILTYHRVLGQEDSFVNDITIDTFSKQIKLLSENFNVLRLDEAAELLSQRCLPAAAVCITFDDGYADNFELAFPILKTHSVPATFFVATGFLDGGIMWNDIIRHACRVSSDSDFLGYIQSQGKENATSTKEARVELMHETINRLKYRDTAGREELAMEFSSALSVTPSDSLMMTTEQVAELARSGMEVAAHTVNHAILKKLPLQEARYEIEKSRAFLEKIIGQRVVSFAFPNGRPGIDFDQSHLELLSDLGFRTAVTTEYAAACYANDPLALPRLGLWDSTGVRIAFRLLSYYVRL